jgi:hypothetical protein
MLNTVCKEGEGIGPSVVISLHGRKKKLIFKAEEEKKWAFRTKCKSISSYV